MTPPGFRGIYRTDELARALYAEAAGIARAMPSAVAVPADADDASRLVAWARQQGIGLIARGSGSGMAGGAVGEGVVVDLSRLDQIEPIDRRSGRIRVGAGALRDAVNAHALAAGLRFPVDPSSGAFCTMGGMAATNAAGARSLRYGATRPWVTALDCIFDDGTRAVVRRGEPVPKVEAIERFLEDAAPLVTAELPASLRRAGSRLRKNSSGYAALEYARDLDLVDLLVGSEGTLALFVGLELALAPRPAATSSVLATFEWLDDAVRAAHRAREEGATACELLDRTFLDVARLGPTAPSLPAATESVLLVEAEGDDAGDAAEKARMIARAFDAEGAALVQLALDPRAETALWNVRHAASPILSRLDPHLKSMQFIEDGAVPPAQLGAYVAGVREALAAEEMRGVIFGHAGDSHVHVNPLVDIRLPDWRQRVERILGTVTGLIAGAGGTLAGEHGDGRIRAPLASQVWGEEATRLFASIKKAFDPAGILNPGVKLPLPGQRAIAEVKYDPAAPPLPTRARQALDEIERAREYASFRLSLVPRTE